MSEEKACSRCSRDVQLFHNEMCKLCYDNKVLYDYVTDMHRESYPIKGSTIMRYYEDELKDQVESDLVQGNLKQYYFNTKTLHFERFREENKGDYNLDIRCKFMVKLELPDKHVYLGQFPEGFEEIWKYSTKHGSLCECLVEPEYIAE